LEFSWEFININGGGKENRSHIHVSHDFLQGSTQSLSFLGGNPALQTNKTLGEWFKSVVTYPELFNGSYSPISELISDPTKASTYQDFVEYYMSHGCFPVEPTMTKKCTISTAYVKSKPTYTVPPPPSGTIAPQAQGVEFMSQGYNAVTGESRLDILQYTYNQGKTYTDPEYGVVYRIPDSLFLQSIPETFIENSSLVFRDSVDWQMKQTSWSFSGGLFFSKSSTTTTFNERFYEKDEAMSLNEQYYSSYRLTQPPVFLSSQLSPIFEQVIKALPAYSIDTQQEYFEFIESFGTHIPVQAIMGGKMTYKTWFHRCFLKTESEKWISQQSGWSFFGLISHGSTKQKFTKKLNETFVQWSTSVFNYQGGNPTIPAASWPQWVKTIHGNLVPLRYNFAPISDLVTGPLASDLEQAISDYISINQKQADANAAQLAKKDPHTMPSWCHGY
jgi:hypothetical protein